jgi:hypothetical protein
MIHVALLWSLFWSSQALAALSKQLRDLVERDRVGELDRDVLVRAGTFDPRLRAGV